MEPILIVKLVLWIVSIVFSVIVLVITEQKLRIEDTCAFGFEFDPDALSYNNVKEACHVALAVAVMGMVFGIVGFVLEIVVEKGGAVMIVVKKFIFLGLMILAIVVAVLWIATFIYLIYLWENKTTSAHLVDETKNSARGVLALTFLSGATKVILAVLEKIDHGKALSVPIP